MATGSPRPPVLIAAALIRKSGSGSGETGFCPEIFFSLFSLLRTSWDLRNTPRRFPYHLIRIQTGKSGFSKIQIFQFFHFLSLKTPQHGNILQVQCNMLSRGPLVLYIIIISECEPDTFCSFKFLFKQILGARIYT